MSHSSDLLSQARHLAGKESRRPKQASLRRAVSAAYYSLFHLLVADAASSMLKGKAVSIRPVFQRAFAHAHMKRVAQSFAGGTVSDAWKGPMGGASVSEDLRQVASAFVSLQEARHKADYDLSHRFSRGTARVLIDIAEAAAGSWRNVRNDLEGQVFLTALLVDDRISRVK